MKMILGVMPDTVGRPYDYWDFRGAFLDCRGTLIISSRSHWGWGTRVITRTHVISDGDFHADSTDRPVIVEAGAQIYSFATLYNCHIKRGAIVACGSVVRNMTVEPYTMVEGNPARVIKKWDGKKWASLRQSP